MTPEALWKRYAAIWPLASTHPDTELGACLADDATYCDPNGLLSGPFGAVRLMGQFQKSVAGGSFRIQRVLHHHDRPLADWELQGKDGSVLQSGTSFGTLSEDGRLRAISGFFRPAVA